MKSLRLIACGLVLALSWVVLSWAADLPTADPKSLGFSFLTAFPTHVGQREDPP